LYCPHCGLDQPSEHNFCIRCGTRLPRHLLPRRGHKIARWFWAVPVAPHDPHEAAVRVTRYLEEFDITTPEGSVRIPSQHVRFSTWIQDRAVCAVSLPDDEAEQLAMFILSTVGGRAGTREQTLS
jgi:hypothetical protein